MVLQCFSNNTKDVAFAHPTTPDLGWYGQQFYSTEMQEQHNSIEVELTANDNCNAIKSDGTYNNNSRVVQS